MENTQTERREIVKLDTKGEYLDGTWEGTDVWKDANGNEFTRALFTNAKGEKLSLATSGNLEYRLSKFTVGDYLRVICEGMDTFNHPTLGPVPVRRFRVVHVLKEGV